MPRIDLLQLRAGTAAQWTTADPVLAAGEPGLETDTRKLKYGDGATAWSSLPYASGESANRGNTAAVPTAGGTGVAGAIQKGDYWRSTADITYGGNFYAAGTVWEAAVNAPASNADWIKYATQL